MTDSDPNPIYTELARQWAHAATVDAYGQDDPVSTAEQLDARLPES